MRYEQLAGQWLAKKGYRIIAHNFHSYYGEIDLIAMDGQVLVFAEVKYRTGARFGDALEAVNARKQWRICRTADYFCMKRPSLSKHPCRFDVVTITGDEFRLLQNAFPYQEMG